MYGHAIASVAASLGISAASATVEDMMAIRLIDTAAPSHTKLSVGDKAHRAFKYTKLYKPNGAREVARRLRQSAAA